MPGLRLCIPFCLLHGMKAAQQLHVGPLFTPFPQSALRDVWGTRRFINSGVIMVRAGAMKHFIAEYYLRASQINAEHGARGHWDDQTCVPLS